MQETREELQVQYLGQEDPLEKEMQPTLVFLPGESHEQPMGSQKSWAQLSN